MKKLFTLLALTGCITAQAQEYPFFEGNISKNFLIGKPTVSFNNGPVVSLFVKNVHKFKDETVYTRFEVHCPTGMLRVVQEDVYVNGYHSGRYGLTNWEHSVPGTLGDSFKTYCK